MLWGNGYVEVGCICPYNRGVGKGGECEGVVRILLVLTNVGLESLRDIRMEIVCGKDVVVSRGSALNNSGTNRKEEVRGSSDKNPNQWQYSR